MYKCNDCGNIFDEPATHEEYHSEVDASEYWDVCPYCGEDNFDEYYEEDEEE